MTVAGTIRASRYTTEIERRRALYATTDPDEIAGKQLDLWNAEWRRILDEVPYFRRLRESMHLPDRFRSWREFDETVPPTTRALLQDNRTTMSCRSRRGEVVRMTGGSTSQPLQLPAWKSEADHTRYNMWLGRSWLGITPASRAYWLWGHSHLLGTGVRGWARRIKRRAMDALLGYRRCSAYDLSDRALRVAADEMLRFRPAYVIGYSVALDLFRRVNGDRRDELRRLGLRAVIATAESFPFAESASALEDLFGCRVAMEYGSVETDVIAQERPDEGYAVFWGSYFLEAGRSDSDTRSFTVRITSLYPRCFPLVRYEIGDEIEPLDGSPEWGTSLSRFRRVIGRSNDYVPLADGTRVHSEAFSHAIRACPAVTGFQVAWGTSRLQIRYTSKATLDVGHVQAIQQRLGRIHPTLADATLLQVDNLAQTVAGKTRMVVRDRSA